MITQRMLALSVTTGLPLLILWSEAPLTTRWFLDVYFSEKHILC